MKYLYIFLFIIALHALYNLINYLRYPVIEKIFFKNFSSDTSEKMNAMSHKNQIINYIKYAGVKDKYIPIVQPVGYGKLASSTVSVLTNISINRQDIASNAMDCLLEAKGNYWSRFINSFNPFYWLRLIIFIPKYIFSYLGLKEESALIKIFQLIYWLLAVIFTSLLSVFPEEIKNFIFSILHIS